MKALAELLADAGWTLTGSDTRPLLPSLSLLCPGPLQFFHGHAEEHVPAGADCLIYSPAVPASNPERQAASARGLPQWSYTEMLGRLMSGRRGLSIAGTHGKSTTTAMISWILQSAGRDPSFVFGAELMSTGISGHAGNGPDFVVESCEFQRGFLNLQPDSAVVLNIEPDHFDCFATLESLQSAFADFVVRVSSDGVLVISGDCPGCDAVARSARCRVVTFGRGDGNAWTVRAFSGEESRIAVCRHGRPWTELTLPVPGDHNVSNALAAAALCGELGLAPEDVRTGLATFPGIRRRFERAGQRNGVSLILDYAHHPTAVRATLRTARQQFGSRRLWCAFQPHQVSRTRALLQDFAESFGDADEVLIVPVFAARETSGGEPVAAAEALAAQIAARGTRVRFLDSLDLILTTVDDAAEPGDVLIAMGAGDIDRIHHEFT